MSVKPSLDYLLRRLDVIRARVYRAVAARAARDPNVAADRFHGLCVSDESAIQLAAAAMRPADSVRWTDQPTLDLLDARAEDTEQAGTPIRLRGLARVFALDPTEVEILLLAAAPDLDVRFERLYGYLNDDVSHRRATIALALELTGLPTIEARSRELFHPAAPLPRNGLVEVSTDRPLLSRSLTVPQRITDYLLGSDQLDPMLVRSAQLLPPQSPPSAPEFAGAMATVLAKPVTIYLQDQPGRPTTELAAAALTTAHGTAIRLGPITDNAVVASAIREAKLRRCGLLLVSAEQWPVGLLGECADADVPVVAVGTGAWNRGWSKATPVFLTVPPASPEERAGWWHAAAAKHGTTISGGELSQYQLTPSQIDQALTAAANHAEVEQRPLTIADLRSAARSRHGEQLSRLARRIQPRVGWGDLVLCEEAEARLRELLARTRCRERVLGEWRMRPSGGHGRSVSALFSGASGTGKTFAAEVIAGELGLDLYVINLATVVDKYIGETEKNLEMLFSQAAELDGILLFDEADALFGTRSAVRDARDRYANIETAYLLQRLETYSGLAILTTNLSSNIDEAFTRRLDMVVTFPEPEEHQRFRLWQTCLPAQLPKEPGLDLVLLARRYPLTGGSIRSCALSASYRAASEHRAVRTSDLLDAVRLEYRKLGRLVLREDFVLDQTPA